MTRARSRLIVLLAMVAALVGAALGPAAAKQQPDTRCFGVQSIAGTAQTFFSGLNDESQPYFEGTADFRVGGLRFDDVALTTTLLDPETTSHEIVFPLGTMTTVDELILVPTDDPLVMSLRSRLDVTDGGTGRLHLLPKSTLTFELVDGQPMPVAAGWEMRGSVCFDEA